MKLAVFDVGGTFIKFAYVEEDGEFYGHDKCPTPNTKKEFYECIHHVVDERQVDGLAFSLPGFIDSSKGYIALGGSLRYHDDCYFVKEMEEAFHLPVTIQNDAKCAALAEIWKGKAKDYKNVVVVVFGTGVGGALIQEGKVYIGSHFMSSELSGAIYGDVAKEGFQATVGVKFSIPRLMERIGCIVGEESMDGERAFMLLKEGNQGVIDEMERFYKDLAIQFFNMHCYYDPDVFLIGGGISVQEEFINGIQDAIDAFLQRLPFPLPPIHVMSTSAKDKANLFGAHYQFLLKHNML